MRISKITDNEILFDNDITITDYHDQDCCEDVYADFKALLNTPAMAFDFSESPQIDVVDDAGIKIDGWFIPCYNRQNGYYSSDLELLVFKTTPGHKKEIKRLDISFGTEFIAS